MMKLSDSVNFKQPHVTPFESLKACCLVLIPEAIFTLNWKRVSSFILGLFKSWVAVAEEISNLDKSYLHMESQP